MQSISDLQSMENIKIHGELEEKENNRGYHADLKGIEPLLDEIYFLVYWH